MIRRLAQYYKPHWKLFTLDLVCAFLVAICDEFLPLITREMINNYVPNQDVQNMIRWSIILFIVYVLKMIFNWIISYWGHVTGVYIQSDMRRELFEHLETLPISFFDENKTGSIMSRIINDLQDISEMCHHVPENFFTSGVMLVVSFIMLARIHFPLTMIVFAFIPIAVLFVMTFRKKQLEAFEQTRAKIGEINAEVETSISGVRVTKAYNNYETEIHKFEEADRNYKKARNRAYKYMAIFHSGMTFFSDVMYLVVIVFGGYFFMHGSIKAGDFVAYLLYISMFLSPIRKLVDTYEQLADGITGFKRFCFILDTPSEKDDEGAVDAGKLKGNIVFDDVSFHYGENQDVIHDLSFSIDQGKTVALVGPSGGGKTTICNLIPRFYEIDSGKIMIDGKDIRQYTRKSLRKNIGIVAQDVFLFHGTIRDNILYGRPDATEAEMIDAAKKAEIHDFIMSLPDEYDSPVGERGVKLSGGQRQRISIARVFLKNPEILILDEATSALDNVTEVQIQKSLESLSKGRTVLVVAHRLSTISNADEIVVITDEGIQEKGSHEELIQKKGVYYDLYASQQKEYQTSTI